MHVQLHEWLISDASETVHLPCLDHKDVSCACLELLAVHRPMAAAFTDELNLVVGMTMRAWSTSGTTMKEKDRDAHVAMI